MATPGQGHPDVRDPWVHIQIVQCFIIPCSVSCIFLDDADVKKKSIINPNRRYCPESQYIASLDYQMTSNPLPVAWSWVLQRRSAACKVRPQRPAARGVPKSLNRMWWVGELSIHNPDHLRRFTYIAYASAKICRTHFGLCSRLQALPPAEGTWDNRRKWTSACLYIYVYMYNIYMCLLQYNMYSKPLASPCKIASFRFWESQAASPGRC